MCLGIGCYSGLLKSIKESTYLGRDECPTNLTGTYGMLICNYGYMFNNRGFHDQIIPHNLGRGSGRT